MVDENVTTLQEQIGVSVHSGNLASDEFGGSERAVDRIAALGAATRPRHWSPRLAELLWRLKYGADTRAASPAITLLAHAMKARADERRWRLDGDSILVRFATRALAEWANDRCAICGGRGRSGGEFDPGVALLKSCISCDGKGRIERYTPAMFDLLLHGDHDGQVVVSVTAPCEACCTKGVTQGKTYKPKAERACRACNGSGWARYHDAGRAQALGVDLVIYRKHWAQRFDAVHEQLSRVEASIKRGLQKELDRNTIRA